jgi:hypothetical protein
MIRNLLLPPIAAVACLGVLADLALAERVRVSRKDCQKLVRYVPDPGVAYKPGVDVHGRPVAPADLPGSRIQAVLPKTVEFDVSFYPLAGHGPTRFDQSELYVGTVTYNLENGEVLFNGVPLTNPEKDELARRCRHALQQR